MAYTTINKPSDYFSTNLWVADDSSPRSFTGFGHQPDFVWVKHRGSGSINHTLVDSVRGGDKMLASNTTASEDTKSHGEITSFNSDGITVADGTNSTYPRLYFNDLDPFGAGGGNYVGWSWKGGGTASSNTDGSITSSVSANTTAGFSIVSWTGNATAGATIGHGLGVTPKVIILKGTDQTDGWFVQHQDLGATKFLRLQDTNAVTTQTNVWNDTAPTSNVFSVGNGSGTNGNGNQFITYCFAEKTGYSKFGSYTGNGNADGTFIYTGFKPAFVIAKDSSAVNNWRLFDNKRPEFNLTDKLLFPSLSDAESVNVSGGGAIDILSNGFKIRSSANGLNASGSTYIYMAFAQAPLVGSNGVTAKAR